LRIAERSYSSLNHFRRDFDFFFGTCGVGGVASILRMTS
jgi:hypothetical protein